MTNQITIANISHDRDGSDWSESGGSHVTAALGNTWAHCVNTRLLLGYLPPPHRMVRDMFPLLLLELYVIKKARNDFPSSLFGAGGDGRSELCSVSLTHSAMHNIISFVSLFPIPRHGPAADSGEESGVCL